MIFSLTISLIPANENELLVPLYVSFRHELKTFPSLKHLLSYKRQSQLPDKPFCLELACLLLESSYQAYFRSKLPLPLPASSASNNADIAVTVNERKETEQVQLISSTSSPDDKHIATTAVIDVERLGFSLKHIFYCPELSIFGYLSESKEVEENNSSLLIAFRGSTTRTHISLDFMFTLMALPSLKRKKSYFDRILDKEIMPSDNNSGNRGAYRESSSSSTSTFSYQNSNEPSTSTATTLSIHKIEDDHHEDDEEQQLLNENERHYSADSTDNTPHTTIWEKEIDTTKLDQDPSLEENKTCSEKMKSCGKSIINTIPLINQSLPRIHVGFWQAYASIREQFMSSTTKAIYHKYRKQFGIFLKNRNQLEKQEEGKRGGSSSSLVNEAMDLEILISGHSLG
jgi:hypothetical protein